MTQGASPVNLYDATGKPLPRIPDAMVPSTNGLIFNERGEVLLQKRADNGWWALPGGGVEIGESVEQGAIREVWEETGLDVTLKPLVGVYSDPKGQCTLVHASGFISQTVVTVFEVEYVSGELRISDESTDIGYFHPESLPEMISKSAQIRITDALANQTEPFLR